jgi:hypothetical protein
MLPRRSFFGKFAASAAGLLGLGVVKVKADDHAHNIKVIGNAAGTLTIPVKLDSSRITEEWSRLHAALCDPATPPGLWPQYYAAQQSLAWAAGFEMAESPSKMIEERRIFLAMSWHRTEDPAGE